MKVTSAIASKKIKMLEERKTRLLELEKSSSVYSRFEGETVEPPAYDYLAVKKNWMRSMHRSERSNMR